MVFGLGLIIVPPVSHDKLVPEGQTILVSLQQDMMEVATVTARTLKHAKHFAASSS